MSEPKPKSLFEMQPDAAHEVRLEAEADCATGRLVPHERVRAWLAKLARGERELPSDA